MKNVLLIGDLRCLMNYGAVATSEALRALLFRQQDKITLKEIDSRSYFKMTPRNGWEDSVEETVEKKRLRQGQVLTAGKKSNVKINEYDTEWRKRYMTPIRYDEFGEYADMVLQDKIFMYEKELLSWADIVIVNAEGSIVHGTDRYGVYRMAGLYILFMEYLSKTIFHKDTYVVNHTIDPDNMDAMEMIEHIYPLLDGVYVREALSLDLLQKHGIENAELIPDALFTYNFKQKDVSVPEFLKEQIDFSRPYICIGDSSGIRNNFNTINWDVKNVYKRLMGQLKEKWGQVIFVDGFGGSNALLNEAAQDLLIPSVNIWNCSFEELYKVLEGAEIFISGRWHASILSLMAHTPILLYGADSHKTRGLYNLIGYPYRFFDIKSIPINIDKITEEAEKIAGEDLTQFYHKVDNLGIKAKDNVKMLDFSEE